MNPFDHVLAWCYRRRSPYRARLAALAPGLQASWRASAAAEFPGIPVSARAFMRSAEGLLMFFDATQGRGVACALPSVAADSVWHAWLRWDADDLARFCRAHFGSPIPHLTLKQIGTGALTQTLVACRALQGIPAHGPAIPALFGLDARLRVPNGFGYRLKQRKIVYGRLGANGALPKRVVTHPQLDLSSLLAAGLISQEVYAAELALQHPRVHSSAYIHGADMVGSSDSGSGDDGCSGDNGCSDGGGSSCGSSCGGGYGGGGGGD